MLFRVAESNGFSLMVLIKRSGSGATSSSRFASCSAVLCFLSPPLFFGFLKDFLLLFGRINFLSFALDEKNHDIEQGYGGVWVPMRPAGA